MVETTKYIDTIIDDGLSWYAVKLFTIRQQEVRTYFEEKGLECFVPEQYITIEGRDGKPRKVLRPVVRNLVFVKQSIDEKQFRHIVSEMNYKISVLRKSISSQEYCLIPHDQMYEFRLMCDEVLVKFGPMKGMTGRLVRSNKKYYLLKEIPGIGVMLKISRWCCVPMEK